MFIQIYGTIDSSDDASWLKDVVDSGGQVVSQELVPGIRVNVHIPLSKQPIKVTFDAEHLVKEDEVDSWIDQAKLMRIDCEDWSISTAARRGKAWAGVNFKGVAIRLADSTESQKIREFLKAKRAAEKTKMQAKQQATIQGAKK